MNQLGLFEKEEEQNYRIEEKTTVGLGTHSAQVSLKKRRREATQKLKEVLAQLEGRDILVSQYCDFWWHQDLRLKRLQVQWFYDDSGLVLWGTKGAQVRILWLKFLYQVREQYYSDGRPNYYLDFWNGLRGEPIDSYHRGGSQCLHIRPAR